MWKVHYSLSAPSFLGQFGPLASPVQIFEGIKQLGFEDVVEVSTIISFLRASFRVEIQLKKDRPQMANGSHMDHKKDRPQMDTNGYKWINGGRND